MVKSAEAVERIEWDLGDGKGWAVGRLDPETKTATATVGPLDVDKRRTVRVRARHKASEFATDAVDLVYHPRPPTVEVAPGLPADVLGPDLVLRGAYSDAAAGVPFDVRVIVSGPRPGQVRGCPAT